LNFVVANAVKLIPDFVYRKQGPSSLWVARQYAAAADVALLMDADRLFRGPGCEIVKDQRKIKVARLRISLGGQLHALYLKRYNFFSWRVPWGALFWGSGAMRALSGAAVLSKAGIASAKPVAAVESRCWGMVTQSFFFTEEIEGGKTVDAYWRDDLSQLAGRDGFRRRRNFLRSLAALFRSLHGRQLYHDDLKDANILAVGGGQNRADCFFLLDLEGIRQYRRLSERRRIKNLVQLHRTLGRYLGRTDKICFLKEYLGREFADRREKRLWAGKIARRSARLDRQKLLHGRLRYDSAAS